jgi:hypothetical protein
MPSYLRMDSLSDRRFGVGSARRRQTAVVSTLIALGALGACATGEDLGAPAGRAGSGTGGAAAQPDSGGSVTGGSGGVDAGTAAGGAGGSGGGVADGATGGSGGVDSSAGGVGGGVGGAVGGTGGVDSSAGGAGGVDSGVGGTGGTTGTGGTGGTGGTTGTDACVSETDAAFCTRLGKECGTWTGTDNCGVARTDAVCATCVLPKTCGAVAANACGCVGETDAQFCTRLGKNCGSVSNVDNCGVARTVAACGLCTAPATCAGGGVANVCGCVETDAAFCTRSGKSCGNVTGTDICGVARTAVACGTCTAPQTCGAITANVCGCVGESDTAFCTRLSKSCGSVTNTDNCNAARTVSCGSCTLPQTCGYGGTPNVCGGPDGGAGTFRLELEAGTATGTWAARPFGGIMQAQGTSVCWTGIGMAGATQAGLLYSTGDASAYGVDITLNGVILGHFSLPNCIANGAWDGNCGTVTTALTLPATGSLTGTVCLVATGGGWGALNYVDISGG